MSQNDHHSHYYVNAESVPMCLQHSIPGQELEDAKCLVAFLSEATSFLLNRDDISMDADKIAHGALKCFELLQDKLNIATGNLPFPKSSIFDSSNKRVLWTPDREQGGAHE